MPPQIDIVRLRNDIEALGRIGRTPEGGVSRPSFSRADLEARAWLKDRIVEAGLLYRVDGAGNIFGCHEGAGKAVMAGSHIDTVLQGGMFDGAAGVCVALECLRRIREENLPVCRPLQVAAFTDEEGNLVGDFLGSRAFAGRLDREAVLAGKTLLGPPLKDILESAGFTVEGVLRAHEERPEIEAFLELHIEQGTVLETEEIPIGVVEAFSGKQYRWCSFAGVAAHGGTTPLELRRDAFLGLADFALRATRHVAANHYGSLLTVGKAVLHPGSFSVVPGQTDFSLDFRSLSAETLENMEKELLALAQDVGEARGLEFVSRIVDRTDPVAVSPRITGLLDEECRTLGYPSMRLSSGAGHDAQILAGLCDSGLVFIPCADGLSHAPGESASWDDIEKGANLMLAALIRLAGAD